MVILTDLFRSAACALLAFLARCAEGVGQWRDYHRNILEDYRRSFGEEPWDIVAVGVMTDSDNTKQKARCLYGDVTFLKGQ